MKNKPVIVIAGPTASGKSAVALCLAQKIGGQIISADSVQVYKHLDIGSAKPTADEQAIVPHHLIDILEPWQEYSAAKFSEQAIDAIAQVQSQGQYPIVCGGTGFYLRSVLYCLDFADTPPDPKLRAQLEDLESHALHALLSSLDPQEAEKLHPNDRKRVIRAIEIAQSGERKGAFRAKDKRFDFYQFCLDMPRETLYERIDRRVDDMMQAGFLQEVQSLLKQERMTSDVSSMQSIGYKQLCSHLKGEYTLQEATELIKQQTRRFAKRQLTWFRHEPNVLPLAMQALQTPQNAAEEIIRILRENDCFHDRFNKAKQID